MSSNLNFNDVPDMNLQIQQLNILSDLTQSTLN